MYDFVDYFKAKKCVFYNSLIADLGADVICHAPQVRVSGYQVQGRNPDTPGGSKNASGPVGIPLKRSIRR